MLGRVEEYIKRNGLIESGDRVVVGCSGGADSVCLLLLLNRLSGRLGFTLKVIHVEHGIRGEESRQDADFVKALCKANNLSCKVISVNVPLYASQKRLGHEEAARELRYKAFMDNAGVGDKIALAHHMEDNAETIIFQMARGSGITGLCGMKPSRAEGRVTYIRPLLKESRADIEAFLLENKQDYRTDSTNNEDIYSRNYIRHVLINDFSNVNVKAVSHINEMAEKLSEIEDYLQEEAKRKALDMVTRKENFYTISISKLKGLHIALQRQIVKELIYEVAGRKKDITAEHLESVLSLMDKQSGRSVDLPYNISVSSEYDFLIFEKKEIRNAVDEYLKAREENVILSVSKELLKDCYIAHGIEEKKYPEGYHNCPFGDCMIEFEAASMIIKVYTRAHLGREIPKKTYTKYFDYDKIKDGFCVRHRRAGDYLIADEAGHRKKLSDYFIDQKLPSRNRDKVRLFATESEIIWVVGGRISEKFRVTDQTRYVLEIKYKGENDGLFSKA